MLSAFRKAIKHLLLFSLLLTLQRYKMFVKNMFYNIENCIIVFVFLKNTLFCYPCITNILPIFSFAHDLCYFCTPTSMIVHYETHHLIFRDNQPVVPAGCLRSFPFYDRCCLSFACGARFSTEKDFDAAWRFVFHIRCFSHAHK